MADIHFGDGSVSRFAAELESFLHHRLKLMVMVSVCAESQQCASPFLSVPS
jgi:hypothetical protein